MLYSRKMNYKDITYVWIQNNRGCIILWITRILQFHRKLLLILKQFSKFVHLFQHLAKLYFLLTNDYHSFAPTHKYTCTYIRLTHQSSKIVALSLFLTRPRHAKPFSFTRVTKISLPRAWSSFERTTRKRAVVGNPLTVSIHVPGDKRPIVSRE